MARLAMLIDLTRCIGCDACTVACKQENGTPADVFFARVLNAESGSYPNVKRFYLPVLCNHCENPACLKSCPNKAIFKREDGIVLIDQERCKGTGACVSACPYGNIILTQADKWYLPEDRAYERDFVKPRLKQNVARKCTFCVQRVDQGLKPACVVACPTTARIFGDLESPSSDISQYVAQQEAETGREPFKLLPDAGTDPANMYLATMTAQRSSTLDSPAPVSDRTAPTAKPALAPTATHPTESKSPIGAAARIAMLIALLLLSATARAQQPSVNHQPSTDTPAETWANSSCAGCHGPTAMGGFGPPLAETKLKLDEVRNIVRKGKGMMPAIQPKEASDAEVAIIQKFAAETKLDPSQIPISYKVGALLSVRNVGIGFAVIGLLSILLALKVLGYWVGCAGVSRLRPAIGRFGTGRALAIFVRSLVVDGFCVASLYRKSKFRWAMHGLLIYGFCALGLADMLMSILNPTRAGLPAGHPIKILANLGGLAVLAGIVYVRYRYRKDEYIDNGLTLGRDYVFLNLLALVILTGFLVQGLRAGGAFIWVLPLYALHLGLVASLLISAPFTRFQHVFVVPVMAAMNQVVTAITQSGVDPDFANEPSPGRHHKSDRILAGVLKQIDPDYNGSFRIRYYP